MLLYMIAGILLLALLFVLILGYALMYCAFTFLDQNR